MSLEVSMIQCYVILNGARYIGFYLSISECINGIHEYPQHACARCGERVETLEHTLIHCPMVKELWMFILKLCNRIDASVLGLSERNMLLGCFPLTRTRNLLRYLISVGKFSAWKERVSHQFRKDEKINSLVYFKNYVQIDWKQNSVSWTRKTLSQNGV